MKRFLKLILLSSLVTSYQAHGGEESDHSEASDFKEVTLRTQLVDWISKQTSQPLKEIETRLVLNAKLEKMQCRKDIEFSYASESKRLIKAVCEKNWRRFLRSPKGLDKKPLADPIKEAPNQIVIASDLINKGDRFTKSSLSLSTVDGNPPNRTFTSIEEILGSVASRDLRPGEPIRPEDISEGVLVITSTVALNPGLILNAQLVKEEVRFLDIPKDALNSIDGWDFMEINQPLAPGEIIRERHLRKAKLIRRNDPVRLVSRGSAFQIEATGIALQDGYFGDRIKVSNSESNRTLVGSVIDKSTVEIPVD